MEIKNIIEKFNSKFFDNNEMYITLKKSKTRFKINYDKSKFMVLLKSMLNISNNINNINYINNTNIKLLEELGYSFDLFINLLDNLISLIGCNIYDSNYSIDYLFIMNLLSTINIIINNLLGDLLGDNADLFDLYKFNNIIKLDISLLTDNTDKTDNTDTILKKNLGEIKLKILDIYTKVIIKFMNT